MGMKCCVRKCKSGYDSESPGIKKVSFHSFPSDSDLRDKWIQNIANKNWEPKPTSRVCSLHFEENDFQVSIITVVEFNAKQARARTTKLDHRGLKFGAIGDFAEPL